MLRKPTQRVKYTIAEIPMQPRFELEVRIGYTLCLASNSEVLSVNQSALYLTAQGVEVVESD